MVGAVGHERVSAAVAAAEETTSGEIVTVVAQSSDSYHDVALVLAALAGLLVPALLAVWPAAAIWVGEYFVSGWRDAEPRDLLLVATAGASLAFALAYALLSLRTVRLALTPRPVLRARVRARALDLFRVGAERRTTGRTGILLYVSLGEHMAELVADEAIHTRVREEEWGEAMAALVAEVRQGRVADGLVAAVGHVGRLLAEHLPRAAHDANELPDRVVEL